MRILIVDDQRSVRLSLAQGLKAEGHETASAESGRAAQLKLGEEVFDLVLLDLHLDGDADGLDHLVRLQRQSPGLAVVVCTAQASIETAVEAMRRGALDYLEKPFTPDSLRQVLARVEKFNQLRNRVANLSDAVARSGPAAEFLTEEPAMRAVMEVIERAAGTRASVLILGENGTGKSQLARHVHEASPLRDGPFVTVNCPSLSRELLESELFGHAKGSFTGAVKDYAGKVDAARGGTLFLDEIGELPAELQAKLLRLLQDKTYERVGETRTRAAEVRVVAATNRDLAAAVRAGGFREDLFYRLNVITVTMPPLRERPADLDRLARKFLAFFAEETGRAAVDFAPDAWAALRGHTWPGNVRELRNAIERAVIMSRGDQVQRADLPDTLAAGDPAAGEVALGGLVSLEEIEREHVRRVVARTVTLEEAARVLGIDGATLYRKRKRWAAGGSESARSVEAIA
jgi:NtrC-family two-component system response regulator AlgB